MPDGETYMRRATLVSLFCNIVLVIMKSTALVVVNSLAIAVDLIISVIGLSVSIILFYSIKLATRPADLVHNYGYGKVENVCEAMEGIVLIGVALGMSFQAIANLLRPGHIHHPWVGLSVSAVASTINFVGAYYITKMGKKSSSPAIQAEGMHYRLEGYISSTIAVSFLVCMILRANSMDQAALYVDPLVALGISLFLIIPSFKLAHTAFFNLLDASMEETSQIEILKHLTQHIGLFCEFKDLKTRTSGRKKFVDFTLIIPEDISFRRSHEIGSLLEEELAASIPNCDVSINIEPCDKDCEYARRGEKCPYLKTILQELHTKNQ